MGMISLRKLPKDGMKIIPTDLLGSAGEATVYRRRAILFKFLSWFARAESLAGQSGLLKQPLASNNEAKVGLSAINQFRHLSRQR